MVGKKDFPIRIRLVPFKNINCFNVRNKMIFPLKLNKQKTQRSCLSNQIHCLVIKHKKIHTQ